MKRSRAPLRALSPNVPLARYQAVKLDSELVREVPEPREVVPSTRVKAAGLVMLLLLAIVWPRGIVEPEEAVPGPKRPSVRPLEEKRPLVLEEMPEPLADEDMQMVVWEARPPSREVLRHLGSIAAVALAISAGNMFAHNVVPPLLWRIFKIVTSVPALVRRLRNIRLPRL